MLQSWTVGRKISAGFAAIVVVSAVSGGVTVVSIEAIGDGQASLVDHLDLVKEAQELNARAERRFASVRGFLLVGDDAAKGRIRESAEALAEQLATVRGRTTGDAAIALLAEVSRALDFHAGSVTEIVRRRAGTTDLTAIAAFWDQQVQPAGEAVRKAIYAFVDHEQALADAEVAAQTETSAQATTLTFVLLGATLALAMIIAFWITRDLNRQLGLAVRHMESAAAELQAAANQQAASAREQTTATTEVSTTITELLSAHRQIVESAQQVARIAQTTAGAAEEGNHSVGAARDAIAAVKGQVDRIVHHMLELGQKTQQIGGILDLINELADQTNILSINATIEAAGAGEHGARFAAVAEEIRKLADRVSASAREIRKLIEEVRAAANTTVLSTEDGMKAAEAGTQKFGGVESTFGEIAELIITTADAAKEIELSTRQQSTAVEQVNGAIADVSQAARETETGSRQTLATATELARLSGDLARLVQAPRVEKAA